MGDTYNGNVIGAGMLGICGNFKRNSVEIRHGLAMRSVKNVNRWFLRDMHGSNHVGCHPTRGGVVFRLNQPISSTPLPVFVKQSKRASKWMSAFLFTDAKGMAFGLRSRCLWW